MALVLLLFIVARVVGGRGPGELTRNQQHRRVLASRRDAERMSRRARLVPQVAAVAGVSNPAPGAVPHPAPDAGPPGVWDDAPDHRSGTEPDARPGAPGSPSG